MFKYEFTPQIIQQINSVASMVMDRDMMGWRAGKVSEKSVKDLMENLNVLYWNLTTLAPRKKSAIRDLYNVLNALKPVQKAPPERPASPNHSRQDLRQQLQEIKRRQEQRRSSSSPLKGFLNGY